MCFLFWQHAELKHVLATFLAKIHVCDKLARVSVHVDACMQVCKGYRAPSSYPVHLWTPFTCIA